MSLSKSNKILIAVLVGVTVLGLLGIGSVIVVYKFVSNPVTEPEIFGNVPAVAWKKTFEFGDYYRNIVMATSDGGALGVFENGDIDPEDNFLLAGKLLVNKINQNGHVEWEDRISTFAFTYPTSVIETSDGYLILTNKDLEDFNPQKLKEIGVSSTLNLIKIDKEGKFLWEASPGYGDVYWSEIIESSKGGYYVIGSYEVEKDPESNETEESSTQGFWGIEVFDNYDEYYVLLKVNENGEELWDLEIEIEGWNSFRAMHEKSNGELLIFLENDFDNNPTRLCTVTVDPQGNIKTLVFLKTAKGVFGYNVIAVDDEKVTFGFDSGSLWSIFLPKYFLAQFTHDGEKVWEEKLKGFMVPVLTATHDGGILLAEDIINRSGNSSILLYKTDGTGTVQWSKEIGEAVDSYEWYYLYLVASYPDGSYLLAGSYADESFIIKLTSDQ